MTCILHYQQPGFGLSVGRLFDLGNTPRLSKSNGYYVRAVRNQ